MGMSSSQARLLTLTARQHDVELRAQKLQADKLRMANDSDKVYRTYMDALSATKIQARVYDQWQPDTFKDASLAMLEHGLLDNPAGDVIANPLFLQETGQNGSTCILVTQAIADKYGITPTDAPWAGTMDGYFYAQGLTDAQHKKVIGQHDAGGTTTPIPNTVASFSITSNGQNTLTSNFSRSVNPSGVITNSADTTDTTVYNNFKNEITQTDTSSITDINNVSSLTSGQSYKITDAAGLQKLQSLSSQTSGVKIYLANNIAMGSITDWSGISNFAGEFDGNGYTINNLTGSQGLFQSTTDTAVVKNVGLKDVNIDANSQRIGGISTINRAVIENCYVTGRIINGYGMGVGGIVGDNTATIKDCSADIYIEGSGCVGGISGHNSSTVTGCNVTGTVITSNGGGIVGHNTGTTNITDCKTSVNVSGSSAGTVIGRTDNINQITIENVTYHDDGVHSILGQDSSFTGTTGQFKTEIAIPGIDPADGSGDFASNILVALAKAGKIDINNDAELTQYEQNTQNYARILYNSGDQADLLYVANINKLLIDYIQNGINDNDFIDNLTLDIQAGQPITTKAPEYQAEYTDLNTTVSVAENTGYEWYSESKGTLSIPSKETIIKNLETALQQCDGISNSAQVTTFINSYDTTKQEDLATLAYINEIVENYSTNPSYPEFFQLKNAVLTNSSSTYRGVPKSLNGQPIDRYNITLRSGISSPTTTQKTTYTPNMVNDYDWNYDLPEVQSVLQKYLLQKTGIKIIDDEAAYSTNWLTNYINAGLAQFAYFDIDSAFVDNADGTKSVDTTRMQVRGTSLATETCLQETVDEDFVKRAEADYEASMRKINRKETKIDTELQQLEAERTSIKTEQDGLKKVVDDNVQLTFKLFS